MYPYNVKTQVKTKKLKTKNSEAGSIESGHVHTNTYSSIEKQEAAGGIQKRPSNDGGFNEEEDVKEYVIRGNSFGQIKTTQLRSHERVSRKTSTSKVTDSGNMMIVSEVNVVRKPANDNSQDASNMNQVKKIFSEFGGQDPHRHEVTQGTQNIEFRSFNIDESPERMEGKLQDGDRIHSPPNQGEHGKATIDVETQGRNAAEIQIQSGLSVNNMFDCDESQNNSGSFIAGGPEMLASFDPQMNFAIVPAMAAPMAPVIFRNLEPEQLKNMESPNQYISMKHVQQSRDSSKKPSVKVYQKPNKGLMTGLQKNSDSKDMRNTNSHMTQDFNQFAIDDSDLGNTTDGKLITANNTASAQTQGSKKQKPILDVEIKHLAKFQPDSSYQREQSEGTNKYSQDLDLKKITQQSLPKEHDQPRHVQQSQQSSQYRAEYSNKIMGKSKAMNFNNLELKSLLSLRELGDSEIYKGDFVKTGSLVDVHKLSHDLSEIRKQGERISSKLNLYKHENSQNSVIHMSSSANHPLKDLKDSAFQEKTEGSTIEKRSLMWAAQTQINDARPALSGLNTADRPHRADTDNTDGQLDPQYFPKRGGRSESKNAPNSQSALNRRWMNRFFTKRQTSSIQRKKSKPGKATTNAPFANPKYSHQMMLINNSSSQLAPSNSLAGRISFGYGKPRDVQSTFSMDQNSQSTKVKSMSSVMQQYQNRAHSNFLSSSHQQNIHILQNFKLNQEQIVHEGLSNLNLHSSNPYFDHLQNSSQATINTMENRPPSILKKPETVLQSSFKKKKIPYKERKKGSQTPSNLKMAKTQPRSGQSFYGRKSSSGAQFASQSKFIKHYHALNESNLLTFVDAGTSIQRNKRRNLKSGQSTANCRGKMESEFKIIDQQSPEPVEHNVYASPEVHFQHEDNYGIGAKPKAGSPLKKKPTIFQKREEEFQKVYERKVSELRQNFAKAQVSTYMTMTSENQSRVQSSLITPRISSRGQEASPSPDRESIEKQKLKQKARVVPKKAILFKQNHNVHELNIYPQDFSKNNHKLITNRIKVLSRVRRDPRGFYYTGELGKQTKKFVHKDQVFTQEYFDPLRLKIRIMPMTRAPKNQGKTPDFYFMEATKLSLSNNLTQAIESLHKGLSINPIHLYCRFTHGVLMFKLGLISQARQDFALLFPHHPKELLLHYNLALTLLQLGQYSESMETIDFLLKQSQTSDTNLISGRDLSYEDNQLMYDSHLLKAQCLWRDNQPLEAVKSFNIANRFKTRALQKQKSRIKKKFSQLEIELQDYIYREFKYDIQESVQIYMAQLSKSPPPIKEPRKTKQKEEDDGIQRTMTVNDALIINLKMQSTEPREQELVTLDLKEEKKKLDLSNFLFDLKMKSNKMRSARDKKSNSSGSSKKDAEVIGQEHDLYQNRVSLGGVSDLFMRQMSGFTNQPDNLMSLESVQKLKSIASNKRKMEEQKQEASSPGIRPKLSVNSQKKLTKLKSQIENIKQSTQQIKKMIFDHHAEQFYNKLRDKQIEIIDQGTNLRFDQVYGPIIEAQSPEPRAPGKTLSQLNSYKSRTGDMSVTFQKQTESQLTKDEQKQLDLMNSVEQVPLSSDKEIHKVEERYAEFMKANNSNVADVEQVLSRKISGTHFHHGGIAIINQLQEELEQMNNELREKFQIVASQWEHDMVKEEKKIYNPKLADEDVSEFIHSEANQDKSKKEEKFIKEDKIIKKLRDCLQKSYGSVIPDDVCNILENDLEEKKKLREIKSQKLQLKNKRLNNRRMLLIREEFLTLQGSKRSVKILDIILQNLKFFIRFNEHQRRLIFEQAEFLTLPARTIIFKQGDSGDKMYVIIRGRVAVEKKSPEYGNLPIVKALLTDGDHFGELSLIDQEKVDRHTKESDLVDADQLFQEKLKFDKRKASCITVEQTDMLIINSKLSQLLYQPEKKKQTSKAAQMQAMQGIPGKVDLAATSEASSKERDELSKKISILQSQHIFDDIDPRYLIPIACNLEKKTYTYGEFLIKKGEIPKGLFIILNGQCKVVAKRIGSRQLGNQNKDSKAQSSTKRTNMKYMQLHDQVLKNFNPETSILNQVNFLQQPAEDNVYQERGFQNSRVLLDDEGNEVKDRIDYADFMVFTQLTKGNSFGSRVLVPFDLYQKNKRLFFGEKVFERFYPYHLGVGTALGNSEKLTNAQIKAVIDKEPEESYQLKSLLSIVADSAQVQVYVVDKSFMAYLPDKILNQICEKAICLKEEDRPYHEQDILFIIEQFQKWDQFKINTVDKMFEKKRLDKFMMGYIK